MNAKFKVLAYLGVMVVFSTLVIQGPYRLFINLTSSMKGKLFVYKLGEAPMKGDLVVFKHHMFQSLLLKRVTGESGDKIAVEGDVLYLNQEPIQRMSKTSQGYLLTPLPNQIVADDTWFVQGDHPRSFDSRYGEFGLVSHHQILGRAWCVF